MRSVARYLFLAVCLLLAAIPAASAAAEDLIVGRGALEDTTGRLDIADAARSDFRPAPSALSMGSRGAVQWMRLRIRAPAKGSKVVLLIRPTYLNEVRLYEAGTGEPADWKTRVAGNLYPYDQRDRAQPSLSFVIDVTAPEATCYLRLKARVPLQLVVQALEPEEADRQDERRDLVAVFFVTSMVFLLLWALHHYFVDRQPVAGLFALHQAVYTLFGLAATGYLAPLSAILRPAWIDDANAILYMAINATSLLFCRALFRPYEPPPWLMRGLGLLLAAFPVELAAMAIGHDLIAVVINFVVIKITWLFFLVVAFRLRREGSPSRFLVRSFFVIITGFNVVWWLSRQGFLPFADALVGGVEILIVDGLLIGGLYATLLHLRAAHLRRQSEQTKIDLLLVQAQLELEQRLKEQAEIQARTDFLTGLLNRRSFLELAERELARAVRYGRPFALLVIDIDHFKAINDGWGHQTGDKVLQEAARLIGGGLRQVDILGRTGGEEFAAVIVEAEGENALDVAQRVRTAVAGAAVPARPGVPVRVTISAGLTELAGRDIPLDRLLHEADQAMYQAKQAGRNRIMIARGEQEGGCEIIG